ncbi:SEC-C domain-containing protein [Arcanobacterium phocisimile]|uniref:SEC-C domain-containing protein n=1 Tax=Arcanobacterium phocisimile TaxID=1302235 RepID=A0ABX7IGP1_9ACTO|nr:YchJ family metal-binding protein [Arcanobacterium phocisimile]QRV01734.1 SEC-C domain-containing protein [Arcanobacterium phocisimile]
MNCPCDSGKTYAECCEPIHDGARLAEFPEELMRARYSAYALGRSDFVFASWHPKTRPLNVSTEGIRWTGLEIIDAKDAQVEFVASFVDETTAEPGSLHERSVFVRRAGWWFYLEALSLNE